MNALPPIPTSRQVRWNGFRTRILPVSVFIVVLAVTWVIWDEATTHRNAVGIAEGARSLVSTPANGLLQVIHVAPYQLVRAGDPLATVRTVDPRAQLDVLRMELDLTVAETRPSLAEDQALDYERVRLELFRTQTDLAVARVNLRRAENEERRSRALYEENLVSADAFDLIVQTRELHQEEVNAYSNAVAEIQSRLQSLSYLGNPDNSTAHNDELRQKLAALRADAANNQEPQTLVAPIDGLVTGIHRQPGEHYMAGEPLLTISSLQSDRIVGYLRQPYAMPIRNGQRVRVTTRETGRRQFWSEISHVGAQVEVITNTLAVLRVGALWDSGLPFVVRLPMGINLRPGEIVDLAIQRTESPESAADAIPATPVQRQRSLTPSSPADKPIVYRGMADASAAVAVGLDWMVVADDEESVLRLYHREQGGLPAAEWDLTAFLGQGANGKEADIEGSARIGDMIYWVTSHGRNAEGKFQSSRHRLFATKISIVDGRPVLVPHGQPYSALLADLTEDPRLDPFSLAAAAALPPKADGGLNLEGMCTGPQGSVLLGFRNPIPGGRALLLPLLNPSRMVLGEKAVLGTPRLLDLGGHGIRSLEQFQNNYLILAGSAKGGGQSRLYLWDGSDRDPVIVEEPALRSLNPEAIITFTSAGNTWILALSDDGTRLVQGIEAKRLEDPLLKTFRGVTFPLSLSLGSDLDI